MPETQEKKGLYLKYHDFKVIEKLIEEIDLKDLTNEEKHTLWKVKTIIHNLECARLKRSENQ